MNSGRKWDEVGRGGSLGGMRDAISKVDNPDAAPPDLGPAIDMLDNLTGSAIDGATPEQRTKFADLLHHWKMLTDAAVARDRRPG